MPKTKKKKEPKEKTEDKKDRRLCLINGCENPIAPNSMIFCEMHKA